MTGDTIAAIATAMSASGIGIIRISGDDSMEIISKVYRSKGGKKQIKEAESHKIHYGFIYDNDTMIDEVLVMIMKGPRSYTGGDRLPRRRSCHEKGTRSRDPCGCKTGGTGRIYQACLLKRKDRSVSGRGGHRCDPGEE